MEKNLPYFVARAKKWLLICGWEKNMAAAVVAVKLMGEAEDCKIAVVTDSVKEFRYFVGVVLEVNPDGGKFVHVHNSEMAKGFYDSVALFIEDRGRLNTFYNRLEIKHAFERRNVLIIYPKY